MVVVIISVRGLQVYPLTGILYTNGNCFIIVPCLELTKALSAIAFVPVHKFEFDPSFITMIEDK